MPQLILEFSSNILEKNNLTSLFQECHTLLEDILPTDINSCKSRAIEPRNYCIGNADPSNAFVRISLKILPGRSIDTLNNTGEKLMALFKNYFSLSLKQLKVQITLEIMELQKTYFKITT